MSGKNEISGKCVSLSELQTILEMTANNLNFIPYMKVGNEKMVAPGHLLAPWQVRAIEVQDIPRTTMRTLELTRDTLRVIQEQTREAVKLEFRDLDRFRQKRLKLGKNTEAWELTPGAIVETTAAGAPVRGVVQKIRRGRNATVRLQTGLSKEVSVGTLHPIAMANAEETKKSFTHFVSVELEEFSKGDGQRLQLFQDMLESLPNMGKESITWWLLSRLER